MKEIEVKLIIDEQTEAALLELLPCWQQYESKEDGRKPFADWTVEDLFKSFIQAGSMKLIWDRIKGEQYGSGMITVMELTDNQYMTVAEREAARAASGVQEADNGEATS